MCFLGQTLMKLLELMTGPWAVLPDTLREMQSIYATHLKGEKIDVPAIEARLGRPLANEQQAYSVQDGGVGLLRVSGVMAPKANLFMQVSGGISTQMLTQQLNSMAADPRVRSAVFAPDSPGGNVLGIPSAAKALRNLAAAKPTVTVVEGVMASAMYWVGSGSNAVFIDGETDMVGSLGVIGSVAWEPADANRMEFVRGKYKRASVNGQAPTAEYLAYQEAQFDYLYTLLIDQVASNRGASADDVLTHMADGRVFIGQQAIDAGLVDGVSTVDAMVEQLASNPAAFAKRRKAVFALGGLPSVTPPVSASAGDAPQDDTTTTPPKGNDMSQTVNAITRAELERDHAALFASLRTEFTASGATAERERIQAVLAHDATLPGHGKLLATLAFDGKTTGPEAAAQVLQAEGKARATAAGNHAADAPQAAAHSAAPAEGNGGQKTRAQLAADASAYAAEHKCSFVEACQALGIQA